MMVRRVGELWVASLITGPTHNVLGLLLATRPSEAVAVETLAHSLQEERVTADQVLTWVREALAEFNAQHGVELHPVRLQFDPSDTPTKWAYVRLTHTLASAMLAHAA